MTVSFKTFLWFDITRTSLNLRNQRVSTRLSNVKVSSKGHEAFFGKIIGNIFSKLRYLNDDRFGLSISSSNSFSHASNVNILSLCAEILTLSNMMQPLTSKVSRWGNLEILKWRFWSVMLKSVKYNSFKFWHAVMSNRHWRGKKSYPPQPKHKPSLSSLAYWKWAQRDIMTATTMGVTKLSISSSRKANYKMDYQ